jgi:hypothetical protein
MPKTCITFDDYKLLHCTAQYRFTILYRRVYSLVPYICKSSRAIIQSNLAVHSTSCIKVHTMRSLLRASCDYYVWRKLNK